MNSTTTTEHFNPQVEMAMESARVSAQLLVERLQAAVEASFNAPFSECHWGDVGTANHVLVTLDQALTVVEGTVNANRRRGF